jgi:hypothetical protein
LSRDFDDIFNASLSIHLLFSSDNFGWRSQLYYEILFGGRTQKSRYFNYPATYRSLLAIRTDAWRLRSFSRACLCFRGVFCESCPPYWGCESLNEFKGRFSLFYASISAEERTRASWLFKSA